MSLKEGAGLANPPPFAHHSQSLVTHHSRLPMRSRRRIRLGGGLALLRGRRGGELGHGVDAPRRDVAEGLVRVAVAERAGPDLAELPEAEYEARRRGEVESIVHVVGRPEHELAQIQAGADEGV